LILIAVHYLDFFSNNCSRQFKSGVQIIQIFESNIASLPVIHASGGMLEVDSVKASTASDPLDVLHAVCAFIAVMCENRNRKKPNRVLEMKNQTESNRIWKIRTDPALVSHVVSEPLTATTTRKHSTEFKHTPKMRSFVTMLLTGYRKGFQNFKTFVFLF